LYDNLLFLTVKNDKNCYDVLFFDTDAEEECHNWIVMFTYDLLPNNC